MADLVALETFTVAARCGSFARAARELDLSPAMVGRRIQSLEAAYSLKLLERTTRHQRLTEAGIEFLARAQRVLEAAAALQEVGHEGSLQGRIRISAPTIFGSHTLPSIIASFSALHPNVRFEVSLANRYVDLVGEGFDLAIRIGQLASSTLVARRLGTYNFACCASPEFLSQYGSPPTPEALQRARCIINLNFAHRSRWQFFDASGKVTTVDVKGQIEIDSDEAQRTLALSGAGVAYIPLEVVRADLEAGALCAVLPEWSFTALPLHAVRPPSNHVPGRTLAFIDFLAGRLRPARAV